MNWYYSVMGSHVHVSAFMNGASLGNLTFRFEEFIQIFGEKDWKNIPCDLGNIGHGDMKTDISLINKNYKA